MDKFMPKTIEELNADFEARMEKAKQLLLQTNLRIADIGKSVGYPNTSYFCQQFKRFFGVTANSMRENGE